MQILSNPRRNCHLVKEIGVEEHDGDVRFKSGSGNMAVSCMRHASGHNYRNSWLMADTTSTERISSLNVFLVLNFFLTYLLN